MSDERCKTYSLSCNHTVLFSVPPNMGDDIWCFRCDLYSSIVQAFEDWVLECTMCNYIRHYREDREMAIDKATNHALRREHPVHMFRNNRLQFTVGRILATQSD